MRYAVLVARVLLGLPFFFFGLNGFLWALTPYVIIPPPPEMPAAADAFMQALTDAKFMHPVRATVELVAGFMILSGFFLPLGLAMLAPVLVHVVLYHIFLDPQGTVLSFMLIGLEIFLAFAYADAFRGMLQARTKSRWS